jgi:hypothetical protein
VCLWNTPGFVLFPIFEPSGPYAFDAGNGYVQMRYRDTMAMRELDRLMCCSTPYRA